MSIEDGSPQTARADERIIDLEVGFAVVEKLGFPMPDPAAPTNGLVDVTPDGALIATGIASGPVFVAAESLAAEPAVDRDEGWDEIVDISLWQDSGPYVVLGSDDRFGAHLQRLSERGTGWRRLRVYARGRDIARDAAESVPQEHYLLQMWPVEAALDEHVIRQRDDAGAIARDAAAANRVPAVDTGSVNTASVDTASVDTASVPFVTATRFTRDIWTRTLFVISESAEPLAPFRIEDVSDGLTCPTPTGLAVLTGLAEGPVTVTTEGWSAMPPAVDGDDWEDIVEASVWQEHGPLRARGAVEDRVDTARYLTEPGAGWRRVRVHVRGRATDRGQTMTVAVERYLVQVWPVADQLVNQVLSSRDPVGLDLAEAGTRARAERAARQETT